MKILFFGDIYGRPGRKALIKVLPKLIDNHSPDFVLANVENLAHGRGPGAKQLHELLTAGVDGFTSGNHIFDSQEGLALVTDNRFPLVRPANYPAGVPGQGHLVLTKHRKKILIANLMGRVFMGDPLDSPFTVAKELLKTAKKLKIKQIFVDFHAEATSEKYMLGYVLDGKVSAVIGTHTHVQTADARILPRGTAFISDAGFCGALNSAIGVDPEIALRRFTLSLPTRLDVAENGPFVVSGVVIELNDKTGHAESIERIYEVVE